MVLELRVFLLPGSTIFGSLRNLLFLLLYVNWETETRRYYEIVYPLPSEHKSATTMWKEDECQWFSSNDQECVSPRFSPSYEATRYGERNREGLLSKLLRIHSMCRNAGRAKSRTKDRRFERESHQLYFVFQDISKVSSTKGGYLTRVVSTRRSPR